jgi:hypothetical protein
VEGREGLVSTTRQVFVFLGFILATFIGGVVNMVASDSYKSINKEVQKNEAKKD